MKSMFKSQAVFLMVVAAALVSACGSLNPIARAQTAEQKAYALYGEFVVLEEQVVAAVQNAQVPTNFRKALAEADSVAKPIADQLLDAAGAVRRIRAELDQGAKTEEKLLTATLNLQRWYDELVPQLQRLSGLVQGAYR
jgi:hypothetical protein